MKKTNATLEKLLAQRKALIDLMAAHASKKTVQHEYVEDQKTAP